MILSTYIKYNIYLQVPPFSHESVLLGWQIGPYPQLSPENPEKQTHLYSLKIKYKNK